MTTTAPARPALDQIAPAVAALEAKLGGPQQYFEINATPQLVNLFVADAATTTVDAVRLRRRRAWPRRAQPAGAEGNTFAAAAATFDPATILDQVTDQLPDSDIVLFTIAGGPGGAVQYTAGVQSEEGGTLDVTLAADGIGAVGRPRRTLKSLVSGMAGWRDTPLVPLTRS